MDVRRMYGAMDAACIAPIKARPSPAGRRARRLQATSTPVRFRSATDRKRTGAVVIIGRNRTIAIVAIIVYSARTKVGWRAIPDLSGGYTNHVGTHGWVRNAGAVTSPRIRPPPATQTVNTCDTTAFFYTSGDG